MFSSNISAAGFIVSLSRTSKRVVTLTVDVGLCVFTVWFAYYLRLGEFVTLSGEPVWAVLVAVGLSLPIFIKLGLYRTIFRYSGWSALVLVVQAVGLYGLLYFAIFTAWGVEGVPRTVGLIQPLLLLIVIAGSRAFARYWLGGFNKRSTNPRDERRVLIYGAGRAGRQLALAISNSKEIRVVGYLDDNVTLHRRILDGMTIWPPQDLKKIAKRLNVTEVLLAVPSATRQRRNEILAWVQKNKIAVRTLPSFTELLKGNITVSDIQDLDIDDLVGRVSVAPNLNLLETKVIDEVVMITGAGGSIGAELVRQVLNLSPRVLLLVEQSEFALYNIHQEISKKLDIGSTKVVPLIASVQDETRMSNIMAAWRPAIVYHAAAYKHVPLVEHNPCEGIQNNVFGTLIVARAAALNSVRDFVLISTDKAVRPTNIMGASKRVAELILQAFAADGKDIFTDADKKVGTIFSIVRFGNVLGSSGSVIPLFRQQIRAGGPITVTHPDITRYFMTIPEAAQLVMQAGAMANGGEIFVLDMGEPVKIISLARRMIELSGLTVLDDQNPDGDVEILITGIRPGEKLYEELLIDSASFATAHPRIFKADEKRYPWIVLDKHLAQLKRGLVGNDVLSVKKTLEILVEDYSSDSKIVDWLTIAQSDSVIVPEKSGR